MLEGHRHFVQSVAFSPNGARLESGDFDGAISVWDALNLRGPRALNGPTIGPSVGAPRERLGHGHIDD